MSLEPPDALKPTSSMLPILFVFFISAFFSVFGFKLFSVIDTMALVPLLAVVFLTLFGFRLRISFRVVMLNLGVFYSLLLMFYLFNAEGNLIDIHPTIRLFRGLISGVAIYLISFFVASRREIQIEKIFNILCLVFLTCAFAIYLQVVVPSTQPLFSEIWGFNKGIKPLRAFGLSAGYDTSGYLLSWFSGVLLYAAILTKKFRYVALLMIVFLSVLFTSRTSMILVFCLLALVLLTSSKRRELFSARVFVLFSIFITAGVMYVGPIVLGSVFNMEMSTIVLGVEVSSRFATSNISTVLDQHYFIPGSPWNVFFGTGSFPKADPGYTNVINHSGLLSLPLYSSFYIITFLIATGANKKNNIHALDAVSRIWVRILYYSIVSLVLVMFISNFKNLYFYTRGFHEAVLLMLGVFTGYSERLRR